MTVTLSPDGSTKSVLQSALDLARLGLRVAFAHGVTDALECTCGSSHEGSRGSVGKHPLGKAWQRRASTDPQVIRDSYVDGCNVGVVCGEQPDGRFVIAVDVDDAARLASLAADLGDLPPTLSGASPRGARHFFLVPEALPNRTLDGVDIKGSNGFCVVGPSRHHTGAFYTELSGELAELPASWLAFIRPTPKPPRALSSWEPTDKRARGRAEKWANAILDAECRLVAAAAEGTRNTTLHTAALRCYSAFRGVQLPDPHSELVSAARAAGLPELETRRTLASVEKYLDETGGKRTPPDRPKLEVVSAPAPAVSLIDDNGSPAKVEGNVARMLSLYGAPRYDEFADRVVWPNGQQLTDNDVSIVRTWLHSQPAQQRVRAGVETVHAGIVMAAMERPYHPVRDYLRALTWDGKPRNLFASYFGAAKDPYVEAAGRCFLVGAVARVMRPGCKVDTLPVLEGPQGIKKSTALRVLGGEWFSDTPFAPGEKDAYQALRGVWIYELGELAALRGRDVERVKAFVSSRVDHYRKPYGRVAVDVPRQVVFAGSTNAGQYLHDDTGNRRYHPIACTRIDVDALARDRDQLWAEAVHRHVQGESWWLEGDLIDAHAREAEQRRAEDPWEALVTNLEPQVQAVTISELLSLIGVERGKQSRGDQMRLAPILAANGWTRRQARKDGARVWFYVRSVTGR